MSTTSIAALDIDTEFTVTAEHIARFQRDGYIKLKHVLSAEVLEHYGKEITRLVLLLSKEDKPLEQRGTYGKAFLQVMNLWRQSEVVKEFVMGKRLARIATELMGTRGVRMYHDQALYKEPSGGLTPWHADQQYWPLSNPNTCTAWIPLQPTPLELGPLAFSERSHRVKMGRDLEISDESEQKISKLLLEQKLPQNETPFDLGEVSYHYGWTFHRAGPNKSTIPRRVMTIIYMDSDMRLVQPANKNQENDQRTWCPGVKIGDVIDCHLTPVIYSQA